MGTSRSTDLRNLEALRKSSEQFAQQEESLLERPTFNATTDIARYSADKARSSTAVVSTGVYQGVNYKLVRVVGATSKPGLIGKRFGNDFTSPPYGEGFVPTFEKITDMFKRTGADIITNGGGWVTNPGGPRDGYMDGCQILDGVLYRDFNTSGRGRDAIGIRYDGSMKLYSATSGDTGAKMLADGVRHSFSFGPALVKDSVSQNTDNVTISSRQVMAVTGNGDLLLIAVVGQTDVSGLTYKQCGDLAVSLGAVFAIPLDGGGSSQTLINGRWAKPSSDPVEERKTIDFLTIHANVVGDVGTPWYPLEPKNDFIAHTQIPRMRMVDGAMFFAGAFVSETSTVAAVAATLPWWARPESYQRFPATTGAVSQYYDIAPNGDVSLYASATTGTSPRYLSAIRYPAKPI